MRAQWGTLSSVSWIFFVLVTEKNSTAIEDLELKQKLSEVFESPVYLWDLTTKRMWLFLLTLSRWNPDVSPLYQDQLCQTVGLDIGGNDSNNLRALKVAITRGLGIKFLALGNAKDRLYAFENENHRVIVLSFFNEKENGSKITEYLKQEIRSHRQRGW